MLKFYDEKDHGNLFGNPEITPYYAPEDYYKFNFVFDPNIHSYEIAYDNFYDEIYLTYENMHNVHVTVDGNVIPQGTYKDRPEFSILLNNGETIVTVTSNNKTYTFAIKTEKYNYLHNPHPRLMGTFIQPWPESGFSQYTQAEWDTHLDMLLRAGIDTVIVQWMGRTDGNGTLVHDYSPMIGKLLASAQKRCMKVFIGSVIEEESWWNQRFFDKQWRETQNKIGNEMLHRIYHKYKVKYPITFVGWYWAWEMYSQRDPRCNPAWADMFSSNTRCLDEFDEYKMPMLISPFHSCPLARTPIEVKAQWEEFFRIAHWRNGDIFCAQDSVGAGGGRASLPKANALAKAMKIATDNAPVKLDYWVNVENFTESEDGAEFSIEPAAVDRLVKQLDIAGRYTNNIITYSYSHFYDNNAFDAEYLKYITNKI